MGARGSVLVCWCVCTLKMFLSDKILHEINTFIINRYYDITYEGPEWNTSLHFHWSSPVCPLPSHLYLTRVPSLRYSLSMIAQMAAAFIRLKPVLKRQEHFSQFQDTTDALPCHIHLPVCLWIIEPHNRATKKNTSHGNEVLLQDTMHLIQRPCYQQGSLYQDPAGNRTTRRPDHRKDTQTEVVWTCFLFIRSGQNHFARHSERGKKTRQTEKEVGRQHQGKHRPGVRHVAEDSGWQGIMEETSCEVICSAPTIPKVKK